jgi:N-acetylneuraminic acid mutarotase
MRGKTLAIVLSWILIACTSAKVATPAPSTETSITAIPTALAQPTVASTTSSGPAAETWIPKAPMLTNRSEMPAVELNGLIYVPGGFGPMRGGLANGKGPVSDLDVYDPVNDTWKSLAPMPDRRHHEMVAVYKNKIYVFGGFIDPWITKDNSWVYDPQTDQWQTLNPMPAPRTAGAAVTLGDAIYLVGGTTSKAGGILPTWKYNPETDTWQNVASLQDPREHNTAIVLDGKIYALGGRWILDLNSVEIYDPDTNQWTFGPAMEVARAGFGATVLDGKIYVAGGEWINTLKVLNSVEMFDPSTGEWSALPNLPHKLHGVPMVAVNGTLYVIGGSTRSADVINPGKVFAFEIK